jgi:hypothetical protein
MTSGHLQRLKYLIDRFRYDPLGYVQAVIRPPVISDDQRKLLQAVAKPGAHVAVKSGTTTGKTSALAWLVIWFINTHSEARVPCTATKYDQVTKTLWPEIAKWHSKMLPEFAAMIRMQQEKVFLIGHENESFAWPMAAAKDRTEGFQGVHAKNVMFVFDEAAGIPSEIFEAAEGSCSTPGARWIVAGNPNRATGPFRDAFGKHAAHWTNLTFSSLDSPFCHPDYPKRIAAKYGIDSNMYRVRVLGKFPKQDPDSLIPFDWAEESKEREVKPSPTVPRIAGCDPSGGGKDPVGFCIRQGTLAYGFDEWPALDPMPTVGRLKRMYDDKLFDVVHVDAIGVGSGVVSRLQELGIPHVPVNVGIPSIMLNDCNRLRDELWWQAREWFASRIVRIEPGKTAPSDEMLLKFIHEATVPKYTTLSTGKIQVESKDELRKADRLGHSPNLADAFGLTFAQGIPVRAPSAPSAASGPSGSDFPW